MNTLWEVFLLLIMIIFMTCVGITGMIALWRWLGWFGQC